MGNFKDVAVIDVLVKPGDAIEVDGPLVTLETEKATMDVPSTVAGVIDKIVAKKGGTVSPGDVVATVRVEEGAAPAAPRRRRAPPAAPRGFGAEGPGGDRSEARAAAPAPAAAAPALVRHWPRSMRADSPRARQSLGAALRARAGCRPVAGHRHRLQVAHHGR
jgi:pyruvate dehydrogenase E2 component (dihydrolipoamide acetyltransferase)